MPKYTVSDGESRDRIDAQDMDDARQAAIQWAKDGDWNEVESTFWVNVKLTSPEGEEENITVTIDPKVPGCTHPNGHDWQAPHEIVGGLKENPGVWGKGGGVIINEVCIHCWCMRTTDTWAQNMQTGEQGLTSIKYTPDNN